MKKILAAAIIAALCSIGSAFAQSNPGFYYGQVPTYAQWNSYFSGKQNLLATPANSLVANPTSSTSSGAVYIAMPSCYGSTNALTWTPNIGIGCNALPSGSVTSIGLSLPNIFTVTNSPITTSGTLTGSLANQTASYFWAGPTAGNSAATPSFRAIIGSDLPNPSVSTLGGVKSIAAASHNFVSYIDTAGLPHQAQPACGDLSDSSTGCSTTVGTAASINTGTSGGTVPLNNGGFTQSGTANFTGAFQIGSVAQSFPASGNLVGTSDAQTLTGKSIAGSEINSGTVSPTYGGTGVNNGSSTLTLAGNVSHAGAFTQTFTATGNASVTLPVSGTLAILGANSFTGTQTFQDTGTWGASGIAGTSINNATLGLTTPLAAKVTTLQATGNATLATVVAGAWNGSVIGSSYGGAGAVSGALKANGSGAVTQAACGDLSNGSTGCSATIGTAALVNTGTSGGTIPLNNAGFVQSGTANFTGALQIGGAAQAFPTSGNLVGTSDTQTLTGKSIAGSEINSGVIGSPYGGAGAVTGALRANGSGTVSQASCSDLSNGATGCSTAIGTSGAAVPLLNAANTWSALQTFGAGITASPSNANDTLSPTGTGTVTINPTAAGTINNMAIGGTTPLAGTFTSISSASFSMGNGTGGKTLIVNGGNSGIGAGAAVFLQNSGTTTTAVGGYSAITGGAYNADLTLYQESGTGNIDAYVGTSTVAKFNSSGLSISSGLANSVTLSGSAINPTISTSAGGLVIAPSGGNLTLEATAAGSALMWQNYSNLLTGIGPGSGYASNLYYNSGWIFSSAGYAGALSNAASNGAWNVLTAGTGSAGSAASPVTQVSILHTAGANENITLTGGVSGTSNSTIGVSGGSLALSPSVVFGSTIFTGASQGLTQTCTVNQAKTLIFTNGLLTGGTCNT